MLLQWIQSSNVPCQQTAQVCGFSAGPQNNWLITQLINRTVNGTRLPQVSVLMEFELQGCDNCQRTFNTHIYETSTENATTAKNIRSYQQVERVSPEVINGSRVNETVTVNFNTNHSSFYFAIQDETTCLIITRLIVFYHICPKRTTNLISYPEIIAPVVSIVVLPSCVMNAEPVSGHGLASQGLVCTTGGDWSHITAPPGAACRCIDGYFRDDENCARIRKCTYIYCNGQLQYCTIKVHGICSQ